MAEHSTSACPHRQPDLRLLLVGPTPHNPRRVWREQGRNLAWDARAERRLLAWDIARGTGRRLAERFGSSLRGIQSFRAHCARVRRSRSTGSFASSTAAYRSPLRDTECQEPTLSLGRQQWQAVTTSRAKGRLMHTPPKRLRGSPSRVATWAGNAFAGGRHRRRLGLRRGDYRPRPGA